MRRAAGAVAATLASVVLLAACSGPPSQLGAHRVADAVNLVDLTATSAMPALPSEYLATGIVQFDSQPAVSHNVFVSTLFPNSEVEGLNFIGLSGAGTRWQIETNPSCVGFVLTRDGDRELIVILDSDATAEAGKLATRTVATAFESESGAIAWGPVDVPGPARGSGLIFADTPKGIVSDDVSPAVMLSAHNGTVSVAEDATGASTIKHESNGTGLIETAGLLTAVDTATRKVLWDEGTLSRPTDVGASSPVSVADNVSQGDVVFLDWVDSAGDTVVSAHNVRTGAMLAEFSGHLTGPSIIDESSENLAVSSFRPTDGATILTAINPNSGTLWEQVLESDTTPVSASDKVIYLRGEMGNVTITWSDGHQQQRPQERIPMAVLSNGTGLFPTGEPYEYILASPRTNAIDANDR